MPAEAGRRVGRRRVRGHLHVRGRARGGRWRGLTDWLADDRVFHWRVRSLGRSRPSGGRRGGTCTSTWATTRRQVGPRSFCGTRPRHVHDTSQVHWISLVNSLAVVLLLTGVVAMIMARTLRRDLNRRDSLSTSRGAQSTPTRLPDCAGTTRPTSRTSGRSSELVWPEARLGGPGPRLDLGCRSCSRSLAGSWCTQTCSGLRRGRCCSRSPSARVQLGMRDALHG